MRDSRYYISGLLKCMALMLLMVCVGCNDEYNPSDANVPSLSYHYLRPSSTNFNFESGGATKHLQITCEEAKWAIRNSASWLTVVPTSGNANANVKISASQHFSGDTARLAVMTLASTLPDWEYDRAISVSQKAATPYLEISVGSYAFTGAANTTKIAIKSNSSWAIDCNASWIHATKLTEAILQVSVDENGSDAYRSGAILLYNKGGEQKIDITQAPSGVSTSQAFIQIDKDASLFTLKVESEAKWTASTSANWIQVSPNQGNPGISEMEISTTENNSLKSRTGFVYIYTAGKYEKAQIKIEQRGLYLEGDTELAFSSKKETIQTIVESNTKWIVKEAPDWVSLSDSRGEGRQALKVTAQENKSTMARSGVIVIAHETLNLYNKISVRQEGKKFEVNTTALEFGVKASTQTIKITSELSWKSTVSDSWISTNIAKGNGDANVAVSVTETQSYDERFGSIDYSVVDKNIVVNVHQLAKYFVVTDKSFSFSPRGGAAKLSFYTNEEWTVELADTIDWFTLSKTKGTGDGEIVISVSGNGTLLNRQGVFTIHKGSGQTLQFVVQQNAQYLYADVLDFQWFAKGGEGIFTVRAGGDYEVKSSDDWIVIQKMASDTWCVRVAENTEAIVRQGIVSIELTGLSEGEKVVMIPITQTYEGGIYIDRAYQEEVNWDVTSNEGFSISISSYSTDNCWDATAEDGVQISKGEYQEDESYDSLDDDSVDINSSDYSAGDESYDSSDDDSVGINKSNYTNDNEWK